MRILSWNIQWGRGMDGRVDLERTARVARGLDADVLCLQEVAVNQPGLPGGAGEDQVAHLSRLLPGFEAIYGVGSDLTDGAGGRRQFGELILSRRPVLQAFRHLLPWPADPAVPSMQRVAVEAVVEAADLPGGALRVITSHLEYYSHRQRRLQVEALRRLHADGYRHACRPRSSSETDPPFAVLPRGEGAVVCGDFNFAAEAPEHAAMQAPIDEGVPPLLDAWALAHPGAPNAPTVGLREVDWVAGPACYDFFFVAENLAARVRAVDVIATTDASDHQPIVLELRELSQGE